MDDREHVFWSGGPKAKNAAMNFARENNMVTLEMFHPELENWVDALVRHKLDESQNYWGKHAYNRITGPIFRQYSRSFAASVPAGQKVAHIFIGREDYRKNHRYRPGHSASVLHDVEHPILKESGMEISVHLI